jgi:hypothetical protein
VILAFLAGILVGAIGVIAVGLLILRSAELASDSEGRWRPY